MRFGGGEFSTGTTGNFQYELRCEIFSDCGMNSAGAAMKLS